MTVAGVPAAVAGVHSRIAGIEARFGPHRPGAGATTGPVTFDDLLGRAASRLAAAPPATGTVVGAGGASSGGPDVGAGAVAAARRYLGVPYRWGGTDPSTGLDCSGLVQRAYRDLGVELPRVSRDQARAGRPVASLAEARPGDLVAFGSPVDHIGIYAGDGKMVVAPRTGDVVKVQDITRTPTAIRRVVPEATAVPAPAAAVSTTAATAVTASAGTSAFAGLFASAGSRHGVSPALLDAVARHESGYDPTAVSRAGARGLMQLMPETARGLGVDPLDPAEAVDGAARLLAGHLRRYGGSVELALAAYNAGPGAVARHGGVPPYEETKTYIRRVIATMRGASV